MARKERALHMQLYPGWSARDNYAQQGKKKKRKRDKSQGKEIWYSYHIERREVSTSKKLIVKIIGENWCGEITLFCSDDSV